MRGRKPILTVINGGTVKGICPSAPDWLAPQAKAEWERSAPQLFNRNMLTPDVMATLESYCVAAGQVREMEERMREEGRMLQDDDGLRPHPALRVQSAAMREARLLATELGLTPHRKNTSGKENDPSTEKWDSELLA